MYDNILQPPLEAKNQSRLGIASLIISIVAVLVICGDIVLVFGSSGSLTMSPSYTGVDTALTCASAVVALVGVGLGIAAVTQKNTKKVFGILGLVFNALILLGICALMGINILSAAVNL